MTKSITTVWLIALLTGLMSMCAATAQAQNPTSGTTGPLTWKYDTGTKTLTISGKGEMPSYVTIKNNNFIPRSPWDSFRDMMESVVVEEGVTRIGSGAFSSSKALVTVTVPEGVKTIDLLAFAGCSKLSSITLHEGLDTIGSGAFTGCENLETVILPGGLVAIKESAFGGCKNLQTLSVRSETPPRLASNVFKDVPVDNVHLIVPKGAIDVYKADSEWKIFKTVLDPLTNIALPEARIYAADGRLYLTLQTAAPVGIYTLNGVLVRTISAPAGETTVALPQGVYIVRVGERIEKVYVN